MVAAIVVRPLEPVKAVSALRPPIECSPGAALAQPFGIATLLARRLSEGGQQLIAHLGGHEVADRTLSATRLGIEKSIHTRGVRPGGRQRLEQATHPVAAMELPRLPEAPTGAAAAPPPPSPLPAEPTSHASELSATTEVAHPRGC